MAYYGKHLQGRRHPVVRAVAVSTVMVLLALGCSGYLVYRHLEGNVTVSNAFDQITGPRPDREAVSGPKEPLNVLVLGNDSRAGQKAVAGSTPGLSDTTILLHLSADRKRAYGVSVPRDLMVERPACTDKHSGDRVPAQDAVQWNDAFAVGGESCTIQQFEHMTGVRVDHFLVVDFAGFKNMVDALGGVPVCLPQEVNDPIGRIYLPAGSYTVKGEQALDYVRVRHSIGTTDTGDIGRMKRQQTFLAAMANKALAAGTLFNPKRLYDFLNAATKSLTTDRGLHKLTEMASLANQVKGIGLKRVQFLSMPFEAYEPDPNRLQAAPDAKQLWRLLRADKPLPKKFTGNAAKASDQTPKPGQTPSPSKDPTRAAEAARAGLCA
ncbi:LCP family protein [Nocardioides marmoribigeumensis]|uniref:LCP family protein required for cell wall assembly n=1 Tax=Nocardioides marmoribigeumensis TaxID=433649 RepID=A0ABU2BZD4_9ACTN|nr:LCP family protein [Nocardioides marmoribigeumensis]MDR7363753.1 LCP family protein required for cell wall assembly [Nocardioides marmoribigeumensis]